jgi:hypothetical protein
MPNRIFSINPSEAQQASFQAITWLHHILLEGIEHHKIHVHSLIVTE